MIDRNHLAIRFYEKIKKNEILKIKGGFPFSFKKNFDESQNRGLTHSYIRLSLKN